MANKPTAKQPPSRKQKAKKENRMNMRFDDEMTTAILAAGAAIKVEGQDFVRMAIKKLIREVAETGRVVLHVDEEAVKACKAAIAND